MPNEVITQVHRLAVAAEKYDGIVFTYANGNKLPEEFDDDKYQDDAVSSAEGQYVGNTSDTSDDEENEGSTGTLQQVENDKNGNEENGINDDENVDEVPEDVVTEEPYEEDTEDLYKSRITIDDINIVSEKNTSQMAKQQEGEEEQDGYIHTHNYNLRERPTRQSERVSLAITDGNNSYRTTGVETEQQYMTIHPKVHAHVMLTQMNMKQGLLTFGEKGNKAISKEVRQLNDIRAITPMQ